MKPIFALFLLLTNFSLLQSQNPDSSKNVRINDFSASIGLSDFHIRDERASPLTFRGQGIMFNVSYGRTGENHKHLLDFLINTDMLNSDFGEYYSFGIRGYARYNYYYRVVNSNRRDNRFNIFIGGGLSTFLNCSFFFEKSYPEQVSNNLANTWYFVHSIEISVLMDYKYKGKNIFELRLFQPLVSNISRPPYSIAWSTPNSTGLFNLIGNNSFFWEYSNIQLKLMYQRLINEWLNLSFDYYFQYSSYPQPRQLNFYSNYFLAGAHLKF